MAAEFFKRIRHDVSFRIKQFLMLSLLCNAAYSIFLLIISLLYGSQWFFIVSIYYALLSTSRLFLFRQTAPHKQRRERIKTMQNCGYFLLLINLVISAMMFILIYRGQTIKHHEITVITLATYTFSTLTVAIVNSVRYLRKNDHLHSSIKLISLISASVSIVTLTNTMLSTFGEDNQLLRSIILPILSGVVSLFIIACAIMMIRKATLDLQVLKHEKERK